MNQQIKQRLVGAAVLVSLAVIFIPMLLDGGNHSSIPRFGSNVPSQPEFDFEPLEIPLQAVTPIPVDRPKVIHKAVKPAADSNKPVQSKPKASVKPAVTKPAVAVPAPPKPKTSTATVTWVVQVGSFSDSSNALGLRDKLRKNGFTAFVEKYRDKGKSSYRVRVGPELKRENAEKQLQRLKDKLKLKGFIMAHS